MKEGFIMLGRDLQESPLFNEKRVFSKFEAWIDILYEVNYKDGSSLIGSTIIECKRGQSIMSLDSWAKRWSWNKSAVRRFFDLLKMCNMIETENITKTTRITVLLSDSYVEPRNANETQMKRIWNANETHLTPIEEGNKEIKKESNKKEEKTKKVFTPPTCLEVESYFFENGYKREAGTKAYNYYSTANWQDSKGNKVKNWKQKMQGVWFKEEHKIMVIQPSRQPAVNYGRYVID